MCYHCMNLRKHVLCIPLFIYAQFYFGFLCLLLVNYQSNFDVNLNFRGQQWYEPDWWKFGDSKT
jgi:hypothetical protein